MQPRTHIIGRVAVIATACASLLAGLAASPLAPALAVADDSVRPEPPLTYAGPGARDAGPGAPDTAPDASTTAPGTAPGTVSAPARPSAPRGGADPRRDGTQRRDRIQNFHGPGFDTCLAPPLAAMRDWAESSPYGAIGVYVGGRARGCPVQPHLTPGWVREVTSLGWKLLPLYVGSQSPCVHATHKRGFTISHGRAEEMGTSEGRDAVRQAQALGMEAPSALYLDMEAYDHRDARCAHTTLSFVQSWNREVRRHGYLPGFYSSAGSGILHLEEARRRGTRDLPHALWFARWNVPPSVDTEPVLDPGSWQPHRRIHQHRGNVWETHGGRTLHIDRNLVDAPVAVVGKPRTASAP